MLASLRIPLKSATDSELFRPVFPGIAAGFGSEATLEFFS